MVSFWGGLTSWFADSFFVAGSSHSGGDAEVRRACWILPLVEAPLMTSPNSDHFPKGPHPDTTHLGLGLWHSMGLGEHDSVYSTESGDEGRAGEGRTSLLSASTAALSTFAAEARGSEMGWSSLVTALSQFPHRTCPSLCGAPAPELVGGPTTARCSGGDIKLQVAPKQMCWQRARVGRSRWLH